MPKVSVNGYITARRVNPADEGLTIFVIALFRQQSDHVKCQPFKSGVPKILIVSDIKICSSTAPLPLPADP